MTIQGDLRTYLLGRPQYSATRKQVETHMTLSGHDIKSTRYKDAIRDCIRGGVIKVWQRVTGHDNINRPHQGPTYSLEKSQL